MRPAGAPDRTTITPMGSRSSAKYEVPAQALIGKTFFGRFKALSFIGEGSNAHVFLAHLLTDPGHRVVIKRIKPHVIKTPRFRQFFDAEVRTMSQFTHPYAVKLLDASLDEPLGPSLALEYVPGVTLEGLMNRYHRFHPLRAAKLLGPVLHALQAAHTAGIVHRDMKPANLMVSMVDTPAESVKTMDFGFAGFSSLPHIQLAELTGHGQVTACGTPAYVSPEMVRGDATDGRADLYAIGVILYEMLTGRLPFECRDQESMLAAHIHSPPPLMHKIGCADVPPGIEGVVQMLLAKYPNERPQTAKDAAEQIGRAVGWDVWTDTAPTNYEPAEEEVVQCTLAPEPERPPGPEDRFLLSDQFEAFLTERLAVAKLRGVMDDINGVAVASEPGLLRFRIDAPAGFRDPERSSGLVGWLSGVRLATIGSRKDPVEIDLQMRKLDGNRVRVLICFRPMRGFLPASVSAWNERCDALYTTIREYLMAGG